MLSSCTVASHYAGQILVEPCRLPGLEFPIRSDRCELDAMHAAPHPFAQQSEGTLREMENA